MTGRCYDCGRVVPVLNPGRVDERLDRHARSAGDPFACPGSYGGFAPVVVASRHGDGAKGTAPCGHPGTYVTPNMVLCDHSWCPGTPRRNRVTSPLYPCEHDYRTRGNPPLKSCRICGKVWGNS